MDLESGLMAYDPAYMALRCLGYEIGGGNWFTSPRVLLDSGKMRLEVSPAAIRVALAVPLEEIPRLLASCPKTEKYHWGLVLHETLEARLQGVPLDLHHPPGFPATVDEDDDQDLADYIQGLQCESP